MLDDFATGYIYGIIFCFVLVIIYVMTTTYNTKAVIFMSNCENMTTNNSHTDHKLNDDIATQEYIDQNTTDVEKNAFAESEEPADPEEPVDLDELTTTRSANMMNVKWQPMRKSEISEKVDLFDVEGDTQRTKTNVSEANNFREVVVEHNRNPEDEILFEK